MARVDGFLGTNSKKFIWELVPGSLKPKINNQSNTWGGEGYGGRPEGSGRLDTDSHRYFFRFFFFSRKRKDNSLTKTAGMIFMFTIWKLLINLK